MENSEDLAELVEQAAEVIFQLICDEIEHTLRTLTIDGSLIERPGRALLRDHMVGGEPMLAAKLAVMVCDKLTERYIAGARGSVFLVVARDIERFQVDILGRPVRARLHNLVAQRLALNERQRKRRAVRPGDLSRDHPGADLVELGRRLGA